MEQITIAGKTFNAPLRYEEGHELSAGEAAALNQTFHENLRNNFAKRVKDALEGGVFNQHTLQSEFDRYAEAYQFGVRTAGGGTRRSADPVQKEARAIIIMKIDAFLKSKGKSIRNVSKEVKEAKIAQLMQREDILDLARQRVAEAQAIATDDLTEFTEAAE